MKRLCVGVLLGMFMATAGCGGGGPSSASVASANSPLSGNWQITLVRHRSPDITTTFTGFLIQSGNSLAGNVILNSAMQAGQPVGGCEGVGPITGKLDGSNVSLTINEFGQDVSLTGTTSSGTPSMSGQYSNLAGGCTDFPSTGTWSAVQITPLKGNFHGTFVSSLNGTVGVSGNLMQGSNLGGSTATVSGTISSTGTIPPCLYLSTATLTGVISGTTVRLDIYDDRGILIGEIPTTIQVAAVSADATSINGSYVFSSISSSCGVDSGTFQLSFP